MTVIVLAQYKCSHCGMLNTGSKYLSWNNFDGKGPGKDLYVGVCSHCKKEYNKDECFVKDLTENENEDNEFGIPAFIKKKMEK
jgi:DNA-directed RNA polymerase subunit RPC12/RpoP